MKKASVIIQGIKLVLRNIIANKKRNFFTCLGIIMGVAAVMGMSATFDAMSSVVNSAFEDGGIDNTLVMFYDNSSRPRGLTENDISEMEDLDGVYRLGLLNDLPDRHSVYLGKKEFKKNCILGRSEVFFERDKAAKMICGRGFSKRDVESRAKVCVLCKKLAKKMFGKAENAIGKNINISGYSFQIIGVDNVPDFSLDKLVSESNGNDITVPYTVIESLYGQASRNFIVYSDDDKSENKELANREIKQYITDKMHLENEIGYLCMFAIDELKEFEAQQKQQSREQSLIAGICLFVGGIGIMNMMFVSVTERTREIGLRKALGATPKQIQQQFLFEAIILSLSGGVVGAVLGIIISVIINVGMYIMVTVSDPEAPLPFRMGIDFNVMFIGLAFSILVGVVFGWMPARKASRLNPIDALKL
ncbi:MAG: ABC transporter permease [Lachnospiraceae bacterium]|nr:ABC transporter permease [Lachnospiraceae bacterium]